MVCLLENGFTALEEYASSPQEDTKSAGFLSRFKLI